MRAQNITTITRRRRNARRRRVLALTLGICAALAIPASASAEPRYDGYSSVNSITGGSSDPDQPIDGWNHSILNAPAGEPTSPSGSGESPYAGSDFATPNAVLGGDGVVDPTIVTGTPASADDGFDWASGALGAGAVLALAALSGAALLTFRRRTAVSPPAAAS
jgi:hypothetical protein